MWSSDLIKGKNYSTPSEDKTLYSVLLETNLLIIMPECGAYKCL